VRFEAFAALKIKIEILWVVTPFSIVIGYQCFRGRCCLQLYVKCIVREKKGCIYIAYNERGQQNLLANRNWKGVVWQSVILA
jgi:hypothetical protein